MTPQLQQAIRLLQLSTLELQAEVQQALESNPLLEMAEEGESHAGDADFEAGAPAYELLNGQDTAGAMGLNEEARAGGTGDEPPSGEMATDIPQDLPVDTSWDDVYDSGSSGAAAGPDNDMRGQELQGTSSESLNAHLVWQMGLTPFSETDRAIATAIVDAIDEDGYLTSPLEEIHQGLGEDFEANSTRSRPSCTASSVSIRPASAPATCANACCSSCSSCRKTCHGWRRPNNWSMIIWPRWAAAITRIWSAV